MSRVLARRITFLRPKAATVPHTRMLTDGRAVHDVRREHAQHAIVPHTRAVRPAAGGMLPGLGFLPGMGVHRAPPHHAAPHGAGHAAPHAVARQHAVRQHAAKGQRPRRHAKPQPKSGVHGLGFLPGMSFRAPPVTRPASTNVRALRHGVRGKHATAPGLHLDDATPEPEVIVADVELEDVRDDQLAGTWETGNNGGWNFGGLGEESPIHMPSVLLAVGMLGLAFYMSRTARR